MTVAGDGWRDRLSVPSAVLAALVVAVAIVFVSAGTTATASYSPYNDDWDGTTDLRTMAQTTGATVELAHETAAYAETTPSETVAVVLSPDAAYRPDEATRLTDFVRSGGTLVVADDYGPHANGLLGQLNASARLDGRPVRDVREHYRSAGLPVAYPVADHPFVADVESVTLNHGTVVEPGEATPLVNTSEYASLDADEDGALGPNETLETHAVATVERVGEGQVVVVGDASVFINAMVERSGNRNFVRALLSGYGTVVLDHSHTEDLPPAVLAVFVLRESAALQFGLGTVAVGALAVWSRRSSLGSDRVPRLVAGRIRGWVSGRDSSLLGSALGRWRGDASAPPTTSASRPASSSPLRSSSSSDVRATPSELAAHLEREHPDWDRERVERVAAAMVQRREGR